MSLNQLKNPILGARQDIFCKSCECSEMKIADKLEVRDLLFDAVNGDKIELSSLPTHGLGGERLTSNGDGTVSWVPGAGSSGVDYSGVLPVSINKLAIYGATDGLLIKDSSLDESDLLTTQSKANTNESNITNLSLTKLNKAGDTMTGDLNMSSNDITTVNNTQTQSISATDGVSINVQDDINMGLYDLNNVNDIRVNALTTNTVPNIVANNSIDFQTTKSLLNVSNTQTQSISSTDGVSINVQDDINMGLYDLNNCNDIRINALTVNTVPNIVSNNSIDMNNNDLLDVRNMNVSGINRLTPVGGLYAGISDGVIINQASGPTDLLPVSSVGSLSFPANGFKVGDSFHLVVAGIFPSESKSDDITIDVKYNGTTIGSINLDLEFRDFVAPSNFELEMDFVVRSIGVAGVIASNLDFSFNKNVSKDFKGTRSTDITTINTTTPSSLSVLATVNGFSSSIQSRLAYLRKQY
jgi:hypothetical protein